MTKCDGCGKEAGNLFCGKCRMKVTKKTRIKSEKFIPLLFWDATNKCYRFGCTCVGCPANNEGMCGTGTHTTLKLIFLSNRIHEFDGDNIIHQLCG